MRYSNILSNAVNASGLSYQQVADKCKLQGNRITRFYISKLCTGYKPPASDEVNRTLAKVLSPYCEDLTYEKLAVAKYKEIIPVDVMKALRQELKEAI